MPESPNLVILVAYAIQLSLGAVFVAAAVPKLRRPAELAATVAAYGIVAERFVRPVAAALILVETYLAVAFLTGWTIEPAMVLTAVLLVAFGAAVGRNLNRGRIVPCGCFGDPREQISVRSLVRIGLLLAMLASLWTLTTADSVGFVALDSLLAEGADGLQYLIEAAGVACFLVVVGMFLMNLPELLSVLRPEPAEHRSGVRPEPGASS